MQQSQIKPKFLCTKLVAEDATDFMITYRQKEIQKLCEINHSSNLGDYFILLKKHSSLAVIFKYDDGEKVTPLFIFSYRYVSPNVVEASLLIDQRAEAIYHKYPLAIVKWGRERVKEIKADVVLANARADLPEAQKFLKVLGFSEVGLIEKAGAVGEDIFLYKYIN